MSRAGRGFSASDLRLLRAAVELRAEAAEENEERREARMWRRLLAKVIAHSDQPKGA